MADVEDADGAAEKERVKKQLGVLGVLLVLVVMANWKSISKRLGGDDEKGKKRGRGRRSRAVNRRGGAGAARAATPKVNKAASALTPQMIPALDAATIKKIDQVKGAKRDLVPEDVIRYETRNPFIALDLDDTAIMKAQEQAQESADRGGGLGGVGTADAAASGTGLGTLTFRGVMPVEGKRFVILQAANRRVPFYLKEGQPLPNSELRLIRVGPLNAFVTLFNARATRTRDKIMLVARQNVSPAILRQAVGMLKKEMGVIEEKKRREQGFETLIPAMLDLAKKQEAGDAGAGGGFLDPGPRRGLPLPEKPDPVDAFDAESEPEPEPEPEPAPKAPAKKADDFEDDFTFFDE